MSSRWSCVRLLFHLLCYVAYTKEQDIYHVISGESDVPHIGANRLDPVYYVGVYDEKPKLIPANYEIELMTADSGKRFTCIIPKDSTFVSEREISPNKQETKDNEIPKETETESDIYEEDDETEQEPPKTAEELLQEVDTLINRDRYIQETIAQTTNTPNLRYKNTKKNERQTQKRRAPCYYSREGYWNYELCLYDKISQYHGSKKKRNPNLKLGDFATYIDVSKILMEDKLYPYLYLTDIYGLKWFQNTDKNFVHLLYNGGEAKRESLVTVQCSKAYSKRSKDSIIKVSEPKIHHYHFVVIYKAVCDYKKWLRREYGLYESGAELYDDEYIESDTDTNENISSSSSVDLLRNKHIDANSDDVSLLLSPLLDLSEDNQCLLLKQGWWTVELCYGKYIRQIHLEAKKEKNKKGQIVQSLTEWDIKQEHVIGKWDETKTITKDSFTIHKNEIDPQRTYASIVYTNGDLCDLNKEPRKTEIQFRCGMNKERSELVKSREDPSCYYIAQVESPLICGHPDFKIPTAPKHEIICYPFDEKEFVEPASLMKQIADVEVESDAILRMVTDAAQKKYQMEKQKEDNVQDGINDDNIPEKGEL